MNRDAIPGTPRFVDQLERVLRSSVERRADRRRRLRRRGLAAVAAAVVAVAAVFAVLSSLGDGSGGRVETSSDEPGSAPDVPRGPAPPGPTSSSPPTTASPETTVVTGRDGGAPPCAPLNGDYAASVSYPEHAPLRAEATFDDGVRWAICGADPAGSSQILNLRSDDGGATWFVSDTGIWISAHHAGDVVEVRFTDATSADMHIASLVGERDERYETTDGGGTWRCVATADPLALIPGSLCRDTPNETG